MQALEDYVKLLEAHLQKRVILGQPEGLYAPIEYFLGLGGKRLRPCLTLLACESLGGKKETALDAALAVELFHNFSLIHDDIMDEAPLRRGRETVHKKWDLSTAILSGDALLILAYRLFEGYSPEIFQALSKLFSKTALEVCEGQQYDMDFESQNHVSMESYIRMIELKTSVLLAAALQMGAIAAQGNLEKQTALYEFGRSLGIAFQLQDDYLDVFGDTAKVGKQRGGDILAGKKTFLYVHSIDTLSKEKSGELINIYQKASLRDDTTVDRVSTLFKESGAVEQLKNEIKTYTEHAFLQLGYLNLPDSMYQKLKGVGQSLMERKF